MLSRRATLVLSIFIAITLYAILFALAPRISILRASALPFDQMERIRVKIRADVPEEAVTVARRRPDVIVRTGSVSDLLQRTHEALQPWELPKPESAAPEEINQKLAANEDLREYDFDPDSILQKTVDAKILEISRETARPDINVARQFVRPSSERLLGPGDFPLLRTDRIVDDYQPRALPPPPEVPVNTDAQEGGEGPPVGTAPPVQLTAILPGDLPGAPPLKVEELQARATVREAQSRAREESQYSFWDDMLDIQLQTWNPGGGEAGYFRMTILPRSTDFTSLPKDVTFVVDSSSSISQNKLLVTARAVRDALGLLRPEDYFNVVIFSDTPRFFQPRRVPATPDNLDAARKFLENLESGGETDIYSGILPVMQDPPRPNAPGIVVVVSDGRPTIGVRDSRAIINGLSADNKLRNTIFTFGGGNTVNRQMLDLLAYRNKGDSAATPDFNAIDDEMPVWFNRLRSPLLINLGMNFSGDSGREVYPQTVPDFYLDRPVTLYGRYDPDQADAFAARFTGTALSDRKEVIFKADLNKADQGTEAIAQGWAFQKAYYLIDRMSLEGESPDLLAELRGLSQQYKIRTSYDE